MYTTRVLRMLRPRNRRFRRSRRPTGRNGRNRGGRAPPIFSPNWNAIQTSVLRLIYNANVNSNGAGTVAAILYCDPYQASITEHTSDLVNLFAQFRLLGSRLTLVSYDVKQEAAALAVGYQNRQTGLAAPTGFNLVLDNQPSAIWAVANDTSPRGFRMQQRMTGLLYAATSASANTSTDSSGAPGGWQIYGSAFGASVTVAEAVLEVWYEYRSRS